MAKPINKLQLQTTGKQLMQLSILRKLLGMADIKQKPNLVVRIFIAFSFKLGNRTLKATGASINIASKVASDQSCYQMRLLKKLTFSECLPNVRLQT